MAGAVINIFSCKNAIHFLLSVSFRTQFRIATYCRAVSLRIFPYLHSSHITFIGLLPLFIFFVKVPFWRWINHFLRTSSNKFFNLCRPPVGRDLRVRRSIPVLFSFSRSYNGHCLVPPFHLFPATFVLRLRFPSMPEFSLFALFTLPLGYSILGVCLQMGRNHRFSYPPFPYSFAVSLRPFVNLSFWLTLFYLFIGLSSFLKDWNIFCLFLSFLYLYYSRKKSFVKGFLKNFFEFFKFFFAYRK